jgi:hypothetical protein
MNTQHIEKTLAKVRAIFEEASEIIDALPVGDRMNLTNLSKTLAEKHGMSGGTLYPVLYLLTKDYPNTKTKKGPKGGLEKLDSNAVAVAAAADEEEDNDNQ